eukprot:GFUD01008417.1.p1 GENE.GFUD01008417.1~~GFUD01008417.1.p1  ORF type:complete len:455 (-),score=127.15 GFUD01008417.1:138-1502(-)
MVILWLLLGLLAFLVYKLRNPNKPNKAPFLVQQNDIKKDIATVLKTAPEEFLTEMKKKLKSNIFTVEMNEKQTITYVLNPNLFSKILHSNTFDFVEISKQSKKRFGFDVLLNHLPTASKILKTSFRGAHEEDLLERLDCAIKKNLSSVLNSGQFDQGWNTVSLNKFVKTAIVPALVEALFNRDTHYEGFADDLSDFNQSMSTRFAGSDPSIVKSGEAARGKLKATLKNILVCDRSTLSSTLTTLMDDLLDPLQISDQEKINFLLMVLWGSLINMQPTNFWLMMHIARHKDLQKDIAAEADLPAKRRAKTIATVYEVLRLQSRPNMYRYARETCTLKDEHCAVSIRKGQWVALFPRMMHMDQEIHKDPAVFKPGRFLNQAMAKKPPTEKELLVFGQGRGACPANDYTVLALSTIITSLLSVMELKYEDTLPQSRQDTVASTPPPDQDARIQMNIF